MMVSLVVWNLYFSPSVHIALYNVACFFFLSLFFFFYLLLLYRNKAANSEEHEYSTRVDIVLSDVNGNRNGGGNHIPHGKGDYEVPAPGVISNYQGLYSEIKNWSWIINCHCICSYLQRQFVWTGALIFHFIYLRTLKSTLLTTAQCPD